MAIPFYKISNGAWFVNNQIVPSGKYRIIPNGSVLSVIDLDNQYYLFKDVLPTDLLSSENTYYTSFQDLINKTGDFFTNDIKTVKGKTPGTFFGDDYSITFRNPSSAAKWSQGMPLFAIDYSFTSTGRWFIPDDPNDTNYPDGSCCFETGTASDGRCFVSSQQPNRYEPGHLSYFGYTAGWQGLSAANGDFVALIGAFQPGPKSLGLDNQIKEGMMWGVKQVSGVQSRILRIYKNYQIVGDYDLYNGVNINFESLQIFEHQIGYYGIHPSIIWHFNQETKQTELLDYHRFDDVYQTSVQDPNMSLGVLVENQGNTTNIQVYNGSVEFGNYSTRDALVSATGRNIPDVISVASVSVPTTPTGLSGLVAVYRTTDQFETYDSVNATGTTLRTFTSRIENQLRNISAQGSANKTVNLNIYLVPAADVVATFTPVLQYVSVLERALIGAITSVSYANAQLLLSVPVSILGGFNDYSRTIEKINPLLRPGVVAVLALQGSSNTTMTDLLINLNTFDLF